MKRIERLLLLLQALRSYRYPVSGERLAQRLNISLRTLYRDIAALQEQGADIKGEAGVGYVLKPGFFLPPLMFSQDEIEALILGMQWVCQYGDAPLSKGASHVLAKIGHVLPAKMKNEMNTFTLRVGPPAAATLAKENLSKLRKAIRNQNKMQLNYPSKSGKPSQQIIWPFAIGYFTDCRILVAWCEQENKYGHFHTQKIIAYEMLDERYTASRNSLFQKWQAIQLLNLAKGPKK